MNSEELANQMWLIHRSILRCEYFIAEDVSDERGLIYKKLFADIKRRQQLLAEHLNVTIPNSEDVSLE